MSGTISEGNGNVELLNQMEKRTDFKIITFENYLVVHDTKKAVHLEFAAAFSDCLHLTSADFDNILGCLRRFSIDIEKHIERIQQQGGNE